MKPETYEKIKLWKKNNPEKCKEYGRLYYLKHKHIKKDNDKLLQERLDYIIGLFKKN